MKKINHISFLIVLVSFIVVSCSKMAPLTPNNDSKTSVVNYAPQSTAISTGNEGGGSGGNITDPDHDTDHDRDKSKPKVQ